MDDSEKDGMCGVFISALVSERGIKNGLGRRNAEALITAKWVIILYHLDHEIV